MDKNPHYNEDIDWENIISDSKHKKTRSHPATPKGEKSADSASKAPKPKKGGLTWERTWVWVKEFPRAHPVIFNIILIFIAIYIVIWLLTSYMSTWTRHGQEVKVPDVNELPLNIAVNTLERNGFKHEVIDSVFEARVKPGCVVTQVPSGGSTVKPGRTVYLTIVSSSPKTISVPDFMNVSLRQAQASFEGLGIKDIRIKYVPSEYGDLVLGASVDGRELHRGERIPLSSVVTLEVGEVIIPQDDIEDDAEIITDGPDIDSLLDD